MSRRAPFDYIGSLGGGLPGGQKLGAGAGMPDPNKKLKESVERELAGQRERFVITPDVRNRIKALFQEREQEAWRGTVRSAPLPPASSQLVLDWDMKASRSARGQFWEPYQMGVVEERGQGVIYDGKRTQTNVNAAAWGPGRLESPANFPYFDPLTGASVARDPSRPQYIFGLGELPVIRYHRFDEVLRNTHLVDISGSANWFVNVNHESVNAAFASFWGGVDAWGRVMTSCHAADLFLSSTDFFRPVTKDTIKEGTSWQDMERGCFRYAPRIIQANLLCPSAATGFSADTFSTAVLSLPGCYPGPPPMSLFDLNAPGEAYVTEAKIIAAFKRGEIDLAYAHSPPGPQKWWRTAWPEYTGLSQMGRQNLKDPYYDTLPGSYTALRVWPVWTANITRQSLWAFYYKNHPVTGVATAVCACPLELYDKLLRAPTAAEIKRCEKPPPKGNALALFENIAIMGASMLGAAFGVPPAITTGVLKTLSGAIHGGKSGALAAATSELLPALLNDPQLRSAVKAEMAPVVGTWVGEVSGSLRGVLGPELKNGWGASGSWGTRAASWHCGRRPRAPAAFPTRWPR